MKHNHRWSTSAVGNTHTSPHLLHTHARMHAHTHTHICMHACSHTCMHTHARTHTNACTHSNACTHAHTHTHTCAHAHTRLPSRIEGDEFTAPITENCQTIINFQSVWSSLSYFWHDQSTLTSWSISLLLHKQSQLTSCVPFYYPISQIWHHQSNLTSQSVLLYMISPI